MSALDYPVMLRLEGQPVLVVGAGGVALGRVRQLVEVGARVRVIAPVAGEAITDLAGSGQVELVLRPYAAGDCQGMRLVLVATDDRRVTEAVVEEARRLGIWVNAADIPDLCDFTLPAIGRSGPVTVAVSSSGNAPGLAKYLRTRLMPEVGPEVGTLARLIGRLRRREPAGAERTRRLAALVESNAAELIAARDRRGLRRVIRSIWASAAPLSPPLPAEELAPPAHVALVGAGPGDPKLLTLRAAELLRQADVVLHDRLVHPEILQHARPGARLIYVGKEGGGEQVAQEAIHRQLIAHARRGKRVVRLKGGDPFVFGRGGEEALALAQAGIPCEVVPGVSSGVAAPAAAGIPVTHRGLAAAVTFATASAQAEPDWKHLAGAPTLVLFMVGQRLARSAQALMASGRAGSTPAALIESGTWSHQRVTRGTLADFAVPRAEARSGPTLLVVGQVVSLSDALRLGAAAQGRVRAS